MKSQKNNRPFVSVVMPVYNAGGFLVEAIESILKQTYKNFEFVIVDDGSIDDSWKIIKNYGKKDPRIKAFKNKENLGIAKTMNRAISKAKGQFLARMDADDIALPQRLEKQIAYLLRNPEIGILGTQMFEINDKNIVTAVRKVPLTNDNIKKQMIVSQSIQNPSLMINRKNLPANLLWYDSKFCPVDDLDFLFRALPYTKFANLPEYLMVYRKHNDNSSLKNIKRSFLLTLKVRLKALLEYGYKTSPIALLANIVQALIIFTIPQTVSYKLYQLWKGGELESKQIGIENFLFKKRKEKVNLSLVIPVYKAESFIEQNISNLAEFLDRQNIRYELITVADGHVDKSHRILNTLKKKYKNLNPLSYKVNRGRGYALRFGIKRAKYEYIGYIDAGFDIDYSSLETIINNVRKYPDVSVFTADKNHPMTIKENIPIIRKLYSLMFIRLSTLMVGTKMVDTQVGLKVFKRDVINSAIEKLPLKINRFTFDVELIKEIINCGYQICKTPVTIIKEKQSTVTALDVLRMFIDLCRLSYYYNIRSYEMKSAGLPKLRPAKHMFRPIINTFF